MKYLKRFFRSKVKVEIPISGECYKEVSQNGHFKFYSQKGKDLLSIKENDFLNKSFKEKSDLHLTFYSIYVIDHIFYRITKFDDEWFTFEISDHNKNTQTYYLCDSFEGVKEIIGYLNTN